MTQSDMAAERDDAPDAFDADEGDDDYGSFL